MSGPNSNIQERPKALELLQLYYDGTCDVAIVDGEFWVIFGGFTPIVKKVASDDDIVFYFVVCGTN